MPNLELTVNHSNLTAGRTTEKKLGASTETSEYSKSLKTNGKPSDSTCSAIIIDRAMVDLTTNETHVI